MPDDFFQLSAADRREALEVARGALGRPMHLLEKDIWVVWALETLFTSALAPQIVFKGGTSLSKAYGVIRRFSEDIDLTYDIRAIAPDLVAEGSDALPLTRSQENRWSKEIRARLVSWVQDEALPIINSALAVATVPSRARAEADCIYIDYEPLAAGTGYVRPSVTLEFGARSTEEPWEAHSIVCDAAAYVPQLRFPRATLQVLRIERTFWEKATAMHVFCVQGRFRNADPGENRIGDLFHHRPSNPGFVLRVEANAEVVDGNHDAAALLGRRPHDFGGELGVVGWKIAAGTPFDPIALCSRAAGCKINSQRSKACPAARHCDHR